MAHVAPTPQEFVARYPVFSAVSALTIQAVITEANRQVGTNWTEGDYKPAIMALTAHMLTTEGHLDSNIIGKPGLITSESLGDASTSYATPGSSQSSSDYNGTPYGR